MYSDQQTRVIEVKPVVKIQLVSTSPTGGVVTVSILSGDEEVNEGGDEESGHGDDEEEMEEINHEKLVVTLNTTQSSSDICP